MRPRASQVARIRLVEKEEDVETCRPVLDALKVTIGDRQGMLKIRISDLDSTLKGFCLNLSKTSEKGGRPQKYVYFLTRQRVTQI